MDRYKIFEIIEEYSDKFAGDLAEFDALEELDGIDLATSRCHSGGDETELEL
jgi:hypothetical protein